MTGFLWSDDADSFFGDDGRSIPEKEASNKKSERSRAILGASSDAPLSVTQLNAWLKRILDQSLDTFWLAGEIGNLTQSSAGHAYFTIKDATNQIGAVIWRSTLERIGIDLHEGMAILCMGRIDLYGPRGTYQVIVSRVEQQGLGKQQAAFRRLYAKLEREGLFAPERKKKLPKYPTRIGFVTSPNGAAIRDFIEVLRRRWPGANVLIIPSRVQGDGAASEIANGIRVAAKIRPELDVLVVGRGGGSVEDLGCFNEEEVVRAVAGSPLPTVSAVGHEIDVTLCDLAADVRALTPSEAAERIVPSRDEILDALDSMHRRATSLMLHSIAQHETRLRSLASRPILSNPERILDTATLQLDSLHQSLDEAIDSKMQQSIQKIAQSSELLDAISPLKTIARGYSVTQQPDGRVVTSIQDIQKGHALVTRLKDGALTSTVTQIDPMDDRAIT